LRPLVPSRDADAVFVARAGRGVVDAGTAAIARASKVATGPARERELKMRRLSSTAQQALQAAALFGCLGVGAVVVGVLHIVGVVRAGKGYGVLWLIGGALCLWLTGRVLYGVWRETRSSERAPATE
jgi:hypothetical protein